MQLHRADADADMRRQRPAQVKVVDGVAHQRVGIAVAVGRNRCCAGADRGDAVLLEAEFLFQAQRAPLDAAADADIEAVVEILPEIDAADLVGGGLKIAPAAFAAEIPGDGLSVRQRRDQSLRLCIRPAQRHGKRHTGA